MRKIGLIGYGTIGKYIVKELLQDPEMEVCFIYDPYIKNTGIPTNVLKNKLAIQDIKNCDLVVEAAHYSVLKEVCLDVLEYTDILPFSISALADKDFYEKVVTACSNFNTRLFIPHGAILGLDGIYDSRNFLESVEITTIRRDYGTGDKSYKVLFEGTTRQACILYPKNINLHAAVALAGIGFDKTMSAVVVDPGTKKSIHTVKAAGPGIEFEITVRNKPIASSTGIYAPASASSTIKRIVKNGSGLQIV